MTTVNMVGVLIQISALSRINKKDRHGIIDFAACIGVMLKGDGPLS